MIINSTIGQELVPDLRMMTLSHVQVFDPEHLVQPGSLFIMAAAVLGFLALIIGLSTCSTAREEASRRPLLVQARFVRDVFCRSLRPFLSSAAAVPGRSSWSCPRSSSLLARGLRTEVKTYGLPQRPARACHGLDYLGPFLPNA